MIHYEKGGVIVRDAVGSDVAVLKDRLRIKDAEEIAAEGFSAEDALGISFSNSTMRYTIERDGVPVAIFGVVPDVVMGSSARVWFLGAEELGRMKKTFVRGTGVFIERFLERYPVLWNHVDARYTQTIRWLKAFGARFEEAAPFGPEGHLFTKFVIWRG
ncbi:MAG TPA: phage protein Gp13 family protein [Elusimicrobiota bacterium]|jgi:hypothetical protein|nr:phage protein Gp13 family protein [Elusimicrobiota bacterium]